MSAQPQIAEAPVIVNPDCFVREILGRLRRLRLRERRRPASLCCQACIHGNHRSCEAKKCGCLCFSEFKAMADLVFPST